MGVDELGSVGRHDANRSMVPGMAAETRRAEAPRISGQKEAGYRGIWFTLGQMREYGDKYSGGLGTYTANHVPIAICFCRANKTFFVDGGAKDGKRHLLDMASQPVTKTWVWYGRR